jgi:hypothetical protein
LKKYWQIGLVGLIVASIPCFIIGYNIHALRKWSRVTTLEESGQKVEARVTAKEVSGVGRGNYYYVSLRYLPVGGGDSLDLKEEVDEGLYNRIPTDGKWTLYHDADDAESVQVEGNDSYMQSLIYAAAGDVLLLFLIGGTYRIYRKSKQGSPGKG